MIKRDGPGFPGPFFVCRPVCGPVCGPVCCSASCPV